MTAVTALAPAVWGTTYFVTTAFLPADHPLFAALMRALPAGLLGLLIARRLPHGDWWWKTLVLGTLNIGIFFPLLFVAAERLPGGVAATLGATQPILVTFLAVIVLGEALSRWRLVWGLVGAVGVGMVVLGPGAGFAPVGIFAGIGVIALAIFIPRQLKLDQPMLEFRVLRYRMFTLNTALGMCVFIVMIGGMMILPLYMQNMNDFTAMESGLVLLPGAAVMGLMSPVTGHIFDAIGAKWLAVAGFTLLTVTTFMFADLSADTSFTYLAVVNTIRMFGVAMVMMPVTTAALNQLPQSLIPHGTALNNTFRQIAASVGTAVLVTIMVSTTRDPEVYGVEGLVHGADVAFFVAAVVGIFGIVGSFFIKNSHGQNTPG